MKYLVNVERHETEHGFIIKMYDTEKKAYIRTAITIPDKEHEQMEYNLIVARSIRWAMDTVCGEVKRTVKEL